MADRFYVNHPLAPGPVTVDGSEAHHLAVVCRVRPGDQVCLFNGDGHEYASEVRAVTKREVTVDILAVQTPQREVGFRVEVAAPLPKGDRAHFLIEKLTELGVTSFVLLQTERSVVYPREAKLDKLQRTVIEASKQCGRNVLMKIGPLVKWASYCSRSDLPGLRRVAQLGASPVVWPVTQDITLAVGPEGGFTDEEIDQARTNNWQTVGLGPRVLRVETAALVLATQAIGAG